MKISVICSVYNSETWISHYLQALNAQLLNEFEVVFVDASSTDKSLSLIKTFHFREGIEVKIVEETKRVSVYEAWNTAISHATGEYIVNYNTDDLLFPSALLAYSGYIKKHDADIFYSAYFVADRISPLSILHTNFPPAHSHSNLKQGCYCGPFPCVKRDTLIKVGLFDAKYQYSSDYDMWLKLSHLGYKFFQFIEPLGAFLYRRDSVSQVRLDDAQAEDREIRGKY